MSGPRYPGETFSPPDAATQYHPSPTEPNGSDSNGGPSHDIAEETRPRPSFNMAGPPPPPARSDGAPGSDPAAQGGFGEPTLAGAVSNGPNGPPGEFGPPADFGGPPRDFGSAAAGGFGPPPGPAYGDPRPGEFGPPGDFGAAPGGFVPPPESFGAAGPPGAIGTLRPPSSPNEAYGPPGAAGRPGAAGPARPARGPRARGPRRARLQLRHINPWTVLKFSCVLSVALFFVWLIMVGLLYGILQAAGVIGNINDAATTINGSGSHEPITPGLVFGGAAIIGVVNIVLFIALSTVGSVVYNLCADLVGGIEVTLSERD
jgi:hypothetical protein